MNNTTKIIIGIVVVLLIIWAIVAFSKKDSGMTTENPIKVGAILPLTGPIASAGEYLKNGIEMAIEDLKAEGKTVEVFFEDYAYDSKLAISAYNRLKSTEDIDVLIVFGTNGAMPLSPLVNADNMPMLGFLAAANYASPNDYTFRMFSDADSEAKFATEVLVNKLGKKNIGVMYLNNDYGKSGLESFKKYVAGKATIVAEEGAAPGVADYRAQLAKIKAANPDAIFLITLYKEAGTMLKQAKEMGITVPFMCGQPCHVTEVIDAAGGPVNAEGLIVTSPVDNAAEAFVTRYEEMHDAIPGYLTLRGYDGMKIISHIAERCAEDAYSGPCLKKQLEDIKDFPGLSYPIEFDTEGDINDRLLLRVVRNGAFVSYE